MSTFLLVILGLGAVYLWLRGWLFASVVMCGGWIVFAHTPTLLQVVFIAAVSFAPFLVRLGWRNREAIRRAMSEDPKHSALR